jgi:inositol transport system substrate-binding protein
MALGALKAIEDAKMASKIFVCGVDATPDGVAAIAEGRLGGSVSQDTAGMGKLSMDTLFKVVKGETVAKEILTTPVWVTKENAAQFK